MRYLLTTFFFLIYAGDNLGLAVSVAPGMSIKNLLLYLVFTGIAINAAVTRNRKVEMLGLFVMFGSLILYAVLTWVTLTFVLHDPEYQAKQAFITLKSGFVDQLMTFLIFFYGLLHVKDAMWLMRSILWVVMLGNVITVVDTMNLPNLGILPPPVKGGRFEGFLGQPNEYGQFLTLFLPACIVLCRESRGMARLLAGIGVFASGLALVLTGSRGAFVGLVAGAVIACFYLRRYIPAQTVVRAATAAAVICAAIVVTTLVTGYADLYLDRFSGLEGTAHVATSGRSSIWSQAIKSMLENPLSFLSGYGFFSYESSRSFRLSTHNTYLWYLYNLGVIGLFLFLGIFSRILSTARSAIADASERRQLHLMGMIFGVIGFLVATFFSDYHELGYLLWAYVGVVMRVAMELRAEAAAPGIAQPAVAPVAEHGHVRPGLQGWSPQNARGAR